jgi:hypothetical protein
MSRAKRIFRLIQHRLPGLILCKDILVVAPTERILRGFVLETTMERDRVYLWRVVSPLFRPRQTISLNYGNRIPPNEKIYVDRDNPTQAVEEVFSLVSENLTFLRGIRTYSDFLRYVEWRVGSQNIIFNLDLALTYYRIGNVRQSVELIRRLYADVLQMKNETREHLEPILTRLVNQIDANPLGLNPLLDEWNEAAIAALGLEKSRYISVVP